MIVLQVHSVNWRRVVGPPELCLDTHTIGLFSGAMSVMIDNGPLYLNLLLFLAYLMEARGKWKELCQTATGSVWSLLTSCHFTCD
jgi:hypothetical protein